MSDQIKAGDVVQLKSGGPKMTVGWVEDGEALCQWFSPKNEPCSQVYALIVLQPA